MHTHQRLEPDCGTARRDPADHQHRHPGGWRGRTHLRAGTHHRGDEPSRARSDALD